MECRKLEWYLWKSEKKIVIGGVVALTILQPLPPRLPSIWSQYCNKDKAMLGITTHNNLATCGHLTM